MVFTWCVYALAARAGAPYTVEGREVAQAKAPPKRVLNEGSEEPAPAPASAPASAYSSSSKVLPPPLDPT